MTQIRKTPQRIREEYLQGHYDSLRGLKNVVEALSFYTSPDIEMGLMDNYEMLTDLIKDIIHANKDHVDYED